MEVVHFKSTKFSTHMQLKKGNSHKAIITIKLLLKIDYYCLMPNAYNLLDALVWFLGRAGFGSRLVFVR
jgi:hypothetical protein